MPLEMLVKKYYLERYYRHIYAETSSQFLSSSSASSDGRGSLCTREIPESHTLKHIFSVLIDNDNILFDGRFLWIPSKAKYLQRKHRDNRKRYLRDKIQSALTLLLLQLEGDATDGTSLNSLHKVGDESSNFISHSLRRDNSNLAHKLLVNMEIQSQTRVVLLDDNSSGFLDSLRADTLQQTVRESMSVLESGAARTGLQTSSYSPF